jgi:Fe-S-cluster containining protein|tara:strand:- start:264 stop:896 length:633 start_codon:yes stop_codon:yes gene_type:complete
MYDSTQKLDGLLRKSQGNENGFQLSAKFFRDYTCPPMCGGCCRVFTLDFYEGERWDKFKKLYPGHVSKFEERIYKGVKVFTDAQRDNKTNWCRHRNDENGRCMIHSMNPLSCEFELIKITETKNRQFLTKKLFGRGWGFTRVDRKKGALCEMTPFDTKKISRDIELLQEMVELAQRLKVETRLVNVVRFLERHLDKLKNGMIPQKNINFK